MSARDKFKNSNMMGLNNESGAETMTDLIQNTLEADAAPEPSKPIDPPAEAPIKKTNTKKRAPGRPRKFAADEKTVVLGIRVPDYYDHFLKTHGGRYGGKTEYVNLLIQEEMRRVYNEEESKSKED